MSATELILRDPLGERTLSAADFPVSLGGPGHTSSCRAAAPARSAGSRCTTASCSCSRAEGREAPLVNGAPVTRPPGCARATSSTRRAAACASPARDGVRMIDIEDGSGGNLTRAAGGARHAGSSPAAATTTTNASTSVAFRRRDAAARAAPRWCRRLAGALAVALLGAASPGSSRPVAPSRSSRSPRTATSTLRGGPSLRVGEQPLRAPGPLRGRSIARGLRDAARPRSTITRRAEPAFRRSAAPSGRAALEVRSPVAGARQRRRAVTSARCRARSSLPAGRHELVITAPRHQPYIGADRRSTALDRAPDARARSSCRRGRRSRC